ncbi:hypothetical protein J14TS2_21540 [Bacillus sp. J14TS2]|nr:hypothetical protein J14TS2_21540 [Bacillus sp. J14TS2]
MARTKYKGVHVDKAGQFYYETELGTDRITGKRRAFHSFKIWMVSSSKEIMRLPSSVFV